MEIYLLRNLDGKYYLHAFTENRINEPWLLVSHKNF